MGYTPREGETQGSYAQPRPGDAEDRMAAHLANGIIYTDGDDMELAIDGTLVTVGAGECFVAGKRFLGGTGAYFDLEDCAADTFYLYVNAGTPSTPWARSASAPSNAQTLIVGTVDCDGNDTLSNLVDLRPFGLVPAQFDCWVVGAVSADQIGFFIVPEDTAGNKSRNFWLDGVACWAVNNGTAAGPTLIDVHTGASPTAAGVTVFTTQANRPSMAHDLADGTITYNSAPPEAGRLVEAGGVIIVEVDAAATNLADLSVCVFGRWC